MEAHGLERIEIRSREIMAEEINAIDLILRLNRMGCTPSLASITEPIAPSNAFNGRIWR